jgi:cytochrome c-type biogenesis protein
MIESLFTWLNEGLTANPGLALVAAALWGIASILLSPCHLASIPLLIGFITSQNEANKKRVFLLSLTFAIGILVTIAVIGFITALMGRLMGDVGFTGNMLMAAIFVAMGLFLMDLIPVTWNGLPLTAGRFSGFSAALVLGLIFGIGLGPCTFAFMAPVLGVVFQTATTSLASAILLLFSFAIGHCAVIVLAGVLAQRLGSYLNWATHSKIAVYVKRGCGLLVVLGGLYMVWKLF